MSDKNFIRSVTKFAKDFDPRVESCTLRGAFRSDSAAGIIRAMQHYQDKIYSLK